jgi:hypothetical protein
MRLPLEGSEALALARLNGMPPDVMADLAAGRAKLIPLSSGKVAVVDSEASELMSCVLWHYSGHGYAAGRWRGKKTYMHTVVNNTPNNYDTDHINGNGLDNRRCNLRTVTRAQNIANTHKRRANKNNLTGVAFCRYTGRYRAKIHFNKKTICLGRFNTASEAAAAYAKALLERHGKYANCQV